MFSPEVFLTAESDTLLSYAVVAILDASNERLLGTGTFVSSSGEVITAHHVVSGHNAVLIRTKSGRTIHATVRLADLLPEADLAILSTHNAGCDALPIAAVADRTPESFQTRTYQYNDRGFDDAVPIAGRIGGETKLSYGDYHLNEVLTLPDANIDYGASGAPLLDPESRTVVGIIVSKIENGPVMSAAVPFRLPTIQKWQRFSNLLINSNQSLPRFGQLTNQAGANLICRAQRKFTCDFLANAGLLKRGRIINREALTATLLEFSRSDRSIMPLIGMSGVGKTSSLASFADDDTDGLPPRLIVRGVDILATQDGIQALIARTLSPVEREKGLKVRSSPLALQNAAEGRILVLLDGLNEASISSNDLVHNWLPKTVSWLKDTHCKLVVSCRPEFWQLIAAAIPSKDTFGQSNRASEKPVSKNDALDSVSPDPEPVEAFRSTVTLGNFSPSETRSALRLIGWAGPLPFGETLHPFMLALAEQIGFDKIVETPNLYVLLDLFVIRKIERALLRAGRPISSQHVLASVENIAEVMLHNSTEILQRSALARAFNDYTEAIDYLAEEHLWLIEQSGFHFQFDQVREFLQAKSVDPLAVLQTLIPFRSKLNARGKNRWRAKLHTLVPYFFPTDWLVNALRADTKTPPSVVSFAILRLAAIDKWDRVELALALITEAERAAGPSAEYAHDVAISLAARLNNSSKITTARIEWVKTVIETEIRRQHYKSDKTANEEIVYQITFLNCSVAEKLQISRRVLIMEQGFEWDAYRLAERARFERHQQYYRQTPSEVIPKASMTLSEKIDRPVAHLIERLAESDARNVIETLISWLTDETELEPWVSGGHRTKIADCATTSIFYLRHFDCSWVCARLLTDDTIPDLYSQKIGGLIRALAVSETETLLGTCITHIQSSRLRPCTNRILRAAWLCLREPCSPSVILLFSLHLPQLLASDLHENELVWAARSAFEIYFRYVEIAKSDAEKNLGLLTLFYRLSQHYRKRVILSENFFQTRILYRLRKIAFIYCG